MPVGTGRLLPDGHIGRMAVLRTARRGGVGGAILSTLLKAAGERGDRIVELSAQRYVEAFYRRHGFVAEGEPYLEAGIEHVRMRRDFSALNAGN
jgi:predicted GNAT family N-acyltransferase